MNYDAKIHVYFKITKHVKNNVFLNSFFNVINNTINNINFNVINNIYFKSNFNVKFSVIIKIKSIPKNIFEFSELNAQLYRPIYADACVYATGGQHLILKGACDKR